MGGNKIQTLCEADTRQSERMKPVERRDFWFSGFLNILLIPGAKSMYIRAKEVKCIQYVGFPK